MCKEVGFILQGGRACNGEGNKNCLIIWSPPPHIGQLSTVDKVEPSYQADAEPTILSV